MAEPTDSSAPPGESTNPATEPNAPAVETAQPLAQNEPPPVGTNQPPMETSQEPVAPPAQPAEPAEPAPSEAPVERTASEVQPIPEVPRTSDVPATPEVPTEPNSSTAGPSHDANTYQPGEVTQPARGPDVTLPSVESSLPAIDPSLPAMDTSNGFDDSELHSFDALPSIGSSAPHDMSLPAIDTSLPSLDHSLPAIGTDDIPTMDGHDFGDNSHLDHHNSNAGMADSTGGHDNGDVNGASDYHATNGSYQYSHSPAQSQQPGSQQSPQAHTHQFQAQPQHYQQNDMYHNSGSQGQVPQAPIGSPLPNNMPPMASMGQYMAGYPSNMGNAQMRYQLPGDPNKMLSGNRHKKEVKRRTKTGCLTCRKRRIKCDEAHPPPNPPPSLVVNPQGPSTSSTPSYPSYPSAPPGYMPASSQPFAPSLHSESPTASADQHDHAASIDSSLATAHPSSHTEMQNAGVQRQQGSDPSYKAKNLYINDLFSLRGIAPPPPHPVGTLPPGRLEEIQAVFLATYAPAIDKLLEVRWYSENALSFLMADSQLMADYSALIMAFNEWDLQDGETLARLESFEASIIWKSMSLCRQVPDGETGQQGRDWNLCVSCARLNVIEALLTWNHLDSNPLSRELVMDAANPPNTPDQFQNRQLDFWDQVGEFLTLYDNEASSAKQIDDTLGRCRQLLDTYENRDIIYSISVARHLGQRWADFPNSLPKVGYTTEKEAGTRLFVAQKFLEEEAEGKGTTQVYKRVCCMAVRSWWVARG
ncbi:hypothetical protein N7505_011811 [Penicillium chrysogenum]|uniref:Zn(2)-C6 fungal-type domain-containing protein n=1 Tax=Penicillium chrysogenum TaxID=5076 RepID=A0ABQ8W1J9_PENCH|nr:hypothetical protein N7505_011811 [Penicillium chrysogenum]